MFHCGIDVAKHQHAVALLDKHGQGRAFAGIGMYLIYGDTAHAHAVTSLANGNSYQYDANGNQTKRVIGTDTYLLSYDAENKLSKVCKDTTLNPGTCDTSEEVAKFYYDADGKRVKSLMGSETTHFIGGHYEVTNPGSGQTVTKYYFAGAQRIAMRKYVIPSSMSVEYLLSDHLGSTSLTTDSSGAKVSEIRYKAWGEIRYSSTSGVASTPTYKLNSYTFTGQFSDMDDPTTQGTTEGFGLMFYNARWYDPYLNHFTQADTIVPDGMQGYDRYAYVSNNPLRYNDPTGHSPCGDDQRLNCEGRLNNPKPIQHGGCNNRLRGQSCLGKTTTTFHRRRAGIGLVDLIFDPYYGAYVQDLQDNSLTMEQLENIDSIWISADMAYDANDIDLEEIAANGEPNSLTPDQIYEFLTTGGPVEGVLMDRTYHRPYGLFLEILSDKTGNDLLADPMQFEPNYLEALMVAHPDELEAAKQAYQEGFCSRSVTG